MDYPALAQELLALRNDFDRLPEQKQWVQRPRSADDERKHPVELTDAGREAILRRRAETISRIAALLEALGPEDAQEYIRLRQRLLAAGRQTDLEQKEALS